MTTNPWIGLDSYREGQILYGRSREIRDLSMAIFYNRQTIVYGRSGTGKSSLLHAGIFPEARLRGCLPISIRFDHSSDTNYREQLIRTITAAIEAAGGEVRDLLEENHLPESLWEFFHRYQFLRDGKPLTPLLVVDQFEEIFTLSHKKEDVQRFFTELGDLLNDVMPDYLQETAVTAKATDTTSIFGSMTFQTMENRYQTDPSYHLVLVLREDYLSYLERYSQRIPALKQNRYGLLPITYQQALEIIMQPRPGLVSSEVADAIIRHIVTETDLNDETPVDAAILSLFLSRLYEKKGDNPVINLQLVNEQGEALLEDFYAEVVAPLDRKTVYYLEDILINADGHRENVTLETLYKNDWCSRDVVETLEASHLLRLFSYGDVQRVEYAHDVLCPIIVHRKEQRENEARYRRQQRRTFWGYFLGIMAFFVILFAWIKIEDWQASVHTKEQRFAYMENELIKKYCELRIDERRHYNAIRVLINSFRDNEIATPDDELAKKERLLRRAIDSLNYYKRAKPRSSIKINLDESYKNIFCISRSEKLIAFNFLSFSTTEIIDTHTGETVYRYSHKDYDAEKYLNNDRFIGVRINDTTFIATEFNPDERKNTLRISDISPDDYCALIIADDTTLLECYIRSLDNDDEGKTRLALYDFHKPLLTACYSDDGKWIAVMATDTTYYLFDEKQGEYHEELEDSARYFITRNEQRKFLYLRTGGTNEINLRDGTIIDKRYVKSTIRLPEYNKKNDIHSQLYVSTNEDEINDKNTYYNIATMSFEIDRTLMDSLLYADSVDVQKLLKTENHYSWDYYCYIIKYYQMHPELFTPSFPVINCFSPDSKRFFFSVRSEVYGFYVGVNCLSYFKSFDDLEIHTLHMTNDNQWLVINAGEDTQKIIYMKPLPELIEDCKALFFKWEMPIDERFEAYKQLN